MVQIFEFSFDIYFTELFKSHEIDLSTFQTLTEADLREIGVTAMGARRKMMLFISGGYTFST